MRDRREGRMDHDLQGARGQAAPAPLGPSPSSECPGATLAILTGHPY